MSEHEVEAGFDRRSLIKKSLVGAGIAVTAPVISTFNAPAFAQSLDGFFGAQYNVVVNNAGTILSITRVPNDPVGACITEVPAHNGALNMPPTDITATNNTTFVTFTAIEDCQFVDVAADFGPGNPQCEGAVDFAGVPGDPITWTPGTHSGGNRTYRLRLVIDCGI